MAADAALPAESELLELVARYVEAERRVHALLARAAEGGDRRRLLREALLLLAELRRGAPAAGEALERAYLVSVVAAATLIGAPVVLPGVAAVAVLAGSLIQKLTDAVLLAEAGYRRAFARATPETLEDDAQTAVTARIDSAGRRRPLGAWCEDVTVTLGGHAVTRGTVDALPPGTRVRFSSHGTTHPACRPHEGRVYAVEEVPRPPLHIRCGHRLTPAGTTVPELAEAMEQELDTDRAVV